jgi:hypothetical protein
MSKDRFAQDSNDLKNILLKQAAALYDKIDGLERTTQLHTSYYAYLKDFLINSGSLCDDILQGVYNNVTLLAMIGTRTLLEDVINVHYLESKTDQAERMATANDWFRLSKDPEAYKNKLDNISVAARAEAAGTDIKDMHGSEYADFCNYTHSTAQRSSLNMPDHRVLLAKKTTLASLKAYANIVTCVARIVDEKTPEELTSAASAYFDKYQETVGKAPLPAGLDSFRVNNVRRPVNFVETMQVKDGVQCDVYLFEGDETQDLAIVRVTRGFKTSLQKILQGNRTIEGLLDGRGVLTVQHEDGVINTYKLDVSSTEKEIEVKIGQIMQWEAPADTDLVFYEICDPPYKDGRFENLPE